MHVVNSGLTSLSAKLVTILTVAAAWCAAFYLNKLAFSSFDFSSVIISWVFLPAGVRLIAVMLAGWVGVVGLFVGSFTYAMLWLVYTPAVKNVLILSTINSLGPMLALLLCVWGLNIKEGFRGFSGFNLLVLCAVSALFTSLPHNIAFYYLDLSPSILKGFGPMFVGDFLGTLIVLYTIRLLLPKVANIHRNTLPHG
jgi:hypothetical protein